MRPPPPALRTPSSIESSELQHLHYADVPEVPGGSPSRSSLFASPHASPFGKLGVRCEGCQHGVPDRDYPEWHEQEGWLRVKFLHCRLKIAADGPSMGWQIADPGSTLGRCIRGTPSPYCICEVGGEIPHSKCQTRVVENTVDPVWNQHYVFKEPYPGDSLHFIVKNRGVLSGDEDIGKFVLLYEHFYPNGFYGTLQLEDTRKGVSALLTVRVSVKKAGDAKWCHPSSMAGMQLAKSGRIKMQSSNGKSIRSPAAKQKSKASKSHHGHAREFSEYGQTYAQSISDLKAFAEARRHSAPKLARTRSDPQIISSQAKELIHIPTAMAQNMQDDVIPIDIAHDIQEMQEAEQFRQEVYLRKGEEMQRKANAVSETQRQSQTKVLQQAPGQEIRQSHISSDSDTEAAAQYSPDLLKAMHAWYLQAGGSQYAAPAAYDPVLDVAQAWDTVHQLMGGEPTARVPFEWFVQSCLSNVPEDWRSQEYEQYLYEVFQTALCLMLPSQKTDLGKHCFGYASILANEFYFGQPADMLSLKAETKPMDAYAAVRQEMDADWAAVEKDVEGRVSIDAFVNYFFMKHGPKLAQESQDSYLQFLEQNFRSALSMMLPEQKTTLGGHCFRYASLMAGEFYFMAANQALAGNDCGCSAPVADILGITRQPVCSTLIEEQDNLVIEETGFEIVTGQFAGQIGIRFLRASGEITQVYGGAPANIFGVQKGWYILCLDGLPYSRELFHQMIASQEQYRITFFVPAGHRHRRRSIVRGTPVAGEPHDPDVALVDGTRVEDVPGTVVVMGTPIEGATCVVAGTVAASEDFRDLAHQHHSSYSKAHTDSQAPHPSVPSWLADLHPDMQ